MWAETLAGALLGELAARRECLFVETVCVGAVECDETELVRGGYMEKKSGTRPEKKGAKGHLRAPHFLR